MYVRDWGGGWEIKVVEFNARCVIALGAVFIVALLNFCINDISASCAIIDAIFIVTLLIVNQTFKRIKDNKLKKTHKQALELK